MHLISKMLSKPPKTPKKKRLQFNTRLLQSSGLWPPLRGADWTFYWISAEEPRRSSQGPAPEDTPSPTEKKEDQTGALAV